MISRTAAFVIGAALIPVCLAAGGSDASRRPSSHWAYTPPVRPNLPDVRSDDAINPIDQFVFARLDAEGLRPSPPADRARLIRRVYLDLIGLPPTVDQVDAFVSDNRPDAYERVVDTLLASPRYGEKWARQWLDLARYADSNGYQRDGHRSMWAYRDWVINAFNDDMPFDQFTIEQLAGDLLPNCTVEQRVATGFHRCTTVNVEAGVDQEEDRVHAVVDRVNTTATVWLGTTLECAQCHDHKYDPFSQTDYYRLLAYFNNTEMETEGLGGARREFRGPMMELELAEKNSQRESLEKTLADLETESKPLLEAALEKQSEWEESVRNDSTVRLPAAISEILDVPASGRDEDQEEQLREYFLNNWPDTKKTRARIAAVKKQLEAAKPPTTLVMSELAEPRITSIFKRGDFLNKGPTVTAGVPAVLHGIAPDAAPNRLALARWLTSRDNPLVARVTVNRWWAEFFGYGLVRTLEDFGTQGETPTHPELLDWLAVEFMDGPADSPGPARPWSMKHVHKRIVMSATYQQSSRVTPQLLERDPDNRLYARGPRVRLDAETIRDNSLAAAGLLSVKQGGPPVYPPQPEGIWRVTGVVDNNYRTSQGDDRYRRGVYVVWRRSSPYPSFVHFDASDRAACVVQRPRTNTPLQALTLMNDPIYVEAAFALARRMLVDHPESSTSDRVAYGFRRCLARGPQPEELAQLERLLQRELERFRNDHESARKLTAAVQFADVDPRELAAWFYIANVLLNLDEMITKG